VTSAPAVRERFARLLLLAVTALGVAALHTIGHAAITNLDHHPALRAAVTAVVVAAPISSDDDGCAGDGCTHDAAGPADAGDSSRWWEVCIAVLGVLALGAFAVGVGGLARRGDAMTGPAGRRRPPPRPAALPALGLALAAGAVLRT
jgi:hypothetical protein